MASPLPLMLRHTRQTHCSVTAVLPQEHQQIPILCHELTLNSSLEQETGQHSLNDSILQTGTALRTVRAARGPHLPICGWQALLQLLLVGMRAPGGLRLAHALGRSGGPVC